MLDGKALRAAVEKHRPDVDHPRDRGDRHRDAGRARAGRLARRAVGQGGAADHEPRRHPRLRGARARARHLANIASPKAARRRSRRPRRLGSRASIKPVMSSSGKGQSTAKTAEDVGDGLGLCGREDARRPAARDRRGIHQVRQRDHACLRSRPRTASCSAPRSAIARSSAIIARAGSRRRFRERRCSPARHQARKVVEALGGHGIFGVEFFIRGEQAIFSELSPAAARHRDGDPDLAIPEPVRASPERDPRASDPLDRTCSARPPRR